MEFRLRLPSMVVNADRGYYPRFERAMAPI